MKKLCVLFLVSILFSGCAGEGRAKRSKNLLGTIVEITILDQDKPQQLIDNAITSAFSEMQRVESLVSRFVLTSDISRINADSHKRATKVSLETIALIEEAILFSRLSDGAFDITIYPLIELWGIRQIEKKELPTSEQINVALGKIGYQHIDILKKQQSIFLGREQMSLDLGGIAKGYAVDKAIDVLKKFKVRSALINAGGDIYCLGQKGQDDKWRIGIQDPRKKRALLGTLEIKDKAVATSGDYENYIRIKTKKYSHIINPESGYPLYGVPASVTVLAKNCARADALATALFVLGKEKGIALVNQLQDTEAIIVSIGENEKLDIALSRGLEGKLQLNDE